MGDVLFDNSIWSSADQLLNWLFECIQNIYTLMIGNWVLNILLTIGILGLVISLFIKLFSPVKNTQKS